MLLCTAECVTGTATAASVGFGKDRPTVYAGTSDKCPTAKCSTFFSSRQWRVGS